MNQGRSKKQMKGSYKVTVIGIIGMVLTLVLIAIFN